MVAWTVEMMVVWMVEWKGHQWAAQTADSKEKWWAELRAVQSDHLWADSKADWTVDLKVNVWVVERADPLAAPKVVCSVAPWAV